MLRRREVRVRAARPRGGELEHLRPECGEHARRGLGRLDAAEDGLVHRVQVGAHRPERLRVLVAAAGDARRVADADPEQEAPRIGVRERPGSVRGRHRVARVDVGDARGDHGPLREREERRGLREALLRPDALAEPDRRVAELLELGSERARLRRAPQAERSEPHADPSELHQLVSSTKQTPFFVPVAVTAPSQKVGRRTLRKSWSGTIARSLTDRWSDGTSSVQSSGHLRPAAR